MLRKVFLSALGLAALAACAAPDTGSVYSSAGAYVDPAAARKHSAAMIRAAEEGKPVAWSTETWGNSGRAVPVGAPWQDRSKRTCRTLKQDVSMGGTTATRDATACRLAEGLWEITDLPPERVD